MEFRKVISFGKTSYVVSLPKKWVTKNNVKKGDLLSINERHGDLMLSPKKTIEEEEIEKTEINVSEMDPSVIKRIIHGTYKKGIDEISVRYSKPEQLRIIQKLLTEGMIGFEIIRQEKDYCIIRAIAKTFDEEFNSMLRRTFLIQKSMLSGLYDVLKAKDISSISNVRYLEKINNRYTGFCRRVLNKKAVKGEKNITFLYSFLIELERIADECKYVCDYLVRIKNLDAIDKKILELYKKTFDYFDKTYMGFYKFDLVQTSNFLGDVKNLINEAQNIIESNKKTSRETITLAHYVYVILQKISNMLSITIKIRI